MKPNEFGADKQIKEGYAWDAVKQFGRNVFGGEDAGMSAQDKYAKDYFIKAFVSRATGALNAQISSGAVDPRMSMASGAAQQSRPATAPAAPGQQSATAPAAPAPQLTPSQIQQQRLAAATQTARAQMTPRPAAPAAPAVLATPASQTAAAGSRARLQAARQARRLPESHYEQLDAIFESILTEAESIGDYVKDFSLNYMKNDTNIKDPKFTAEVDRLAKEIETTYSRDKGVAALRKLATFAYAQAQVGNRGQALLGQQGQQGQNTQSPQQIQKVNQVKQVMSTINQLQVQQQQKILRLLQQKLAAGTAPAANPTP